MRRKTRFISVEVEIKTDHQCHEYVRWFTALGEPVEVVSCDTHRSHTYFAPLPCGTPDETIHRLCHQISDLPGPARQVWDAAGVRRFCIGYELGDEPLSYEDHLSCATLSLVTSLGAGIGLALYAIPD